MIAGGDRSRFDRDLLGALAIGGGLLAILLAAVIIRPFEAATIDPDAAASVLYFDRIVAGVRLEAFVPTTPKPLLTLLYGATWSIAHDWRLLVMATLVAFGVAVVLAGWWVARVGRSVGRPSGRSASSWAAIVGAAFVMTALAVSPELVLEVSRANSLVWALLGWLVAGLAMTGRRRHPGLAGAALLVAGLARFETFAIVGAAGIALLLQAILSRSGRARPPAGRDWLILVGALALPVACLHDLLLTGDPSFWASVPARYTELYVPGAEPVGPIEYARTVAAHYALQWPVLLLAAVGLASLVARRVWVATIGLVGLGGGVLALLFLLAGRGTYISARYIEPLDLALLGLAGAGTAGIVASALGRRRWASRRETEGRVGPILAALAGVALGVAVSWPPALAETRVERELGLVRAASDNVATYMSRLEELTGPSGPTDRIAGNAGAAGPVGAPLADPAGAVVFVPSLLRPRIAVETGASLTALGDTYAAFVAPEPWAGLHAGQRLYHDRAADRPDALDAALEADPATLGGAVARLELSDEARGVRILVVTGPPAP